MNDNSAGCVSVISTSEVVYCHKIGMSCMYLEDSYTPCFSVSYSAYQQQGGHRSDTNATFSWTMKSCTKIKL